ncbi:MAG TPA: serine O-acetyltransferase EpsC [Tepidisphaeraceae bacterium]|jgi:serine O-acetyltransferase|nr:serine O-acetyltransferase EpsC [Tepidisphaeraceae bacterium]
MDRKQLNERLPAAVEKIVQSINAEPRLQHLNRVFLPSRDTIIETIKLLRQLIFPGYFGKQGLTSENLPARVTEIVGEVSELLYDQVRCCLRYRESIEGISRKDERCDECDQKAADIIALFFDTLPATRALTAEDVQAAFDSDPAAQNTDETIFSYPGVFAITVQRLAHAFHRLAVPLLPRIMTEYAHSLTGIDIHPGAQLGRSFFIDHGTGVVIGETTIIGSNVKIYQGVTLGALAPHFGQMLRGTKRHPTIEDNVTIYAGATILGGDTVIGKGCVIGGNVFITSSVPPLNQVSAEPPLLKYRDRRPKAQRLMDLPLDFQI